MGLIIVAAVAAICLLLGLTGDFLVDWLWFSATGYLDVFWTTIVSEAEVFFAVFVATAIVLWVNGFPQATSTARRLVPPAMMAGGRQLLIQMLNNVPY